MQLQLRRYKANVIFKGNFMVTGFTKLQKKILKNIYFYLFYFLLQSTRN